MIINHRGADIPRNQGKRRNSYLDQWFEEVVYSIFKICKINVSVKTTNLSEKFADIEKRVCC